MAEFRVVRKDRTMADKCQCGAKNKTGHFERIAKQRTHKHEYTGPGKHALREPKKGK